MYDPLTYSQVIQDRLKDALTNHHSVIAGKKQSVLLSNFSYSPTPEPDDYSSQKAILDKRGTLGVSLKAHAKLIDNATGKVIDENKSMVLGQVPTATNRYSFLINGKEYIVHNQTRLRPAVYTKLDRNGLATADFNLAKGANMSLIYMPAKQQIMVGVNKSHVPLYTFLVDIYGMSDADLRKSFGDLHQLQYSSYLVDREKNLKKLFGILMPPSMPVPATAQEMTMLLRRKLDLTLMDPSTNLKTLGKAYSKVDQHVLVHAAQDMMKVYAGVKKPTWKDNLAFKSVHSAEDFIHEKFSNNGQIIKLHNTLKPKIDRAEKLNKIMIGNHYQKQINSFFVDSNLVNYPMQVNPMEMLENAHKVTSLGEGGIASAEALTNDARNLHPSHIGFIDPVRTPDNFNAGVDLRITTTTWKKGDKLMTVVKDKSGKEVTISHTDLFDKVYAVDSEQPDPNTGLYRAFYKGDIIEVPKAKVDFWVARQGMTTVTTGSIPFTANNHGQRSAMGAKMTTQALSLTNREAPLVDTTITPMFGSYYNPKAKVDGVIDKIEKDAIWVRDSAGQTHKHNIPNNFALNYHSYLHATPTIKVGDKVKKGSMLAESNFSKDGKLALGVNATVAFMPMKGYNFEDAIVVSESGAKKFVSSHIFTEELEIPDASIETDPNKFVAYYPNKFSLDQLALLQDGVVKKGTILHHGDPLVLALKHKRESPEVLMLGKITSRISNPFADASLSWEKDYVGEVIDVVKGKTFIKVVIRADAPLVIGDKLCFDEETELLTAEGKWVKVPKIGITTKLSTIDSTQNFKVVEEFPISCHSYPPEAAMEGMCAASTPEIDFLVTPDHDLWVNGTKRQARFVAGLKNIQFQRQISFSEPNVEAPFRFPSSGPRPILLERKEAIKFLSMWISLKLKEIKLGSSLSLSYAEVVWAKGLGFSISDGGVWSDPEVKKALASFSSLLSFVKMLSKEEARTLWDSLEKAIPEIKIMPYSLEYHKQWADFLQFVVIRAGGVGTINVKKTRSDLPLWNYDRAILHVEWDTDKLNPLYKDEAVVENIWSYDKAVWCVTVRTGLLFARRNGKVMVIGNCGRYGNKGIVGAIIPDAEAPRTADGRIPDVFMHPIGITSRMNIGQLFETALGKVIKETGKPPVHFDNFNGQNTFEQVDKAIKESGVKTEESYIDPKTGRTIPNVFSGVQYVMKLAKQTEVNYSARAGGEYDIDLRPIKGGEEGAKNIGTLDFYGYLAHNARSFLREAATMKAEYNPEAWASILSGKPLPAPKPTFVFEKTKAFLQGMGVNVRKEGNILKMTPFTDKDILKISSGEIEDSKMVMDKPDPITGLRFRPEHGGLFDPAKTGGLVGNNFTHIKLARPIPNAMFLKPIRTLLDLQQKELESLTNGETYITVGGKSLTGGEAIKAKLDELNPATQIPILQQQLQDAKSLSAKDTLMKKIKYLHGLRENGMKPSEAYILNYLPVIPPKFRPIYPKETGEVVISDANKLYAEVINVNKALGSPVVQAMGDSSPQMSTLRKALYSSVEKLQGLDAKSDQVKAGDREPVGFLKIITGSNQVKNGYFQSKLLSRSQDLVGRGTVAPDPTLGLDEIALPEPMCWKLYGPFVIGELVRNGYDLPRAKKEVEMRSSGARNMLQAELKKRPCIINRAPTLHKFGMLAFWPRMVQGKTIGICPLIVKGMGMDYDGDTVWTYMAYRLTPQALSQTKKHQLDSFGELCYNPWYKSNELSYLVSKGETSTMSTEKDQPILTKEGLLFIGDFPRIEESHFNKDGIDWYSVPEGIEVQVVGPNGEKTWAQPEFFTVHPTNKMQRIKTSSHRTVLVTEDHSVTTLSEDLEIEKAKPALNLVVPIIKKPVFEHSISEIEFPPIYKGGTKHAFVDKLPLNFDTGHLIGSLVGDGWASDRDGVVSVCFASTTAELEDKWQNTIQKHIVTEGVVHFSKVDNPHDFEGYASFSRKVTWYSSGPFGAILPNLIGKGARQKHFPEFFLSSPIEFRMGLLAGLIDTDGGINVNERKGKKTQINGTITTTSERLAYETVALLNSLGMSAGISESEIKSGTCYSIYLSTATLLEMKKTLLLYHPTKMANLQKVSEEALVDREMYGPPISHERQMQLSSMIGSPRLYKKNTTIPVTEDPAELELIKEKRACYSTLRDVTTKRKESKSGGVTGHMTLALCKKIAKLPLSAFSTDPFWIKWKKWVEDPEIGWDVIVEVKPAPQYTTAYDLSIPPNFTMVTESGMVIWDTVSVHIPISVDSTREAVGMLPSKHLFNPLDKDPMHTPDQEPIMGLHQLSKPLEGKPVASFSTKAEAMAAVREGKIGLRDPIEVKEIIK